jgi:hypothetical protein
MKKIAAILLLLNILLQGSSCFYPYNGIKPISNVEGYTPIYGDKSRAEISFKSGSMVLNNPGKIYVYDKYLFVNEVDLGVHVFDNSDPSAPKDLGFIEILGNRDIAIKDNVMFADHLGDLVSIQMDSFNAISEQKRLSIDSWKSGVRPPRFSYYNCVKPELGVVVSWKKETLKSPNCYED